MRESRRQIVRSKHRCRTNVFRPVVEWLEDRFCLSTLYNFDVIAKTGDLGMTGLGSSASINDNGQVAFVGRFANGSDGIFVGDGTPDSLREVSTSLRNPSRTFRDSVQINNNGQIAAVDHYLVVPFAAYYLRVWDSTTNSYQVEDIASADLQFDAFFDSASINDDGGLAYIGKVAGGNSVVLLRDGVPASARPFADPMIADGGRVVARIDQDAALPSQNPIQLLVPGQLQQTIANSSQFTALGGRPGISDDGQIVVFYGDLSPAGANELNSRQPKAFFRQTPGPGIFASVETTNYGRIIQRIAGAASQPYEFQGILDVNEIWIDANHNGNVDPGEDKSSVFDSTGKISPIQQLVGFDADARVAVSNVDVTERAVTVAFVGKDARGHKGLYTSRLDFYVPDPSQPFDLYQPSSLGVQFPSLVVQEGSVIVTSTGEKTAAVSAFSVSDPINNRGFGDLAFWVSAGGTQYIMHAQPVTSDFHPDSPLVQQVIPSPNSGARAAGASTSQVILHAMAGTEYGSIKTFQVPGGTSIHYLISRDGRVTQMVPENRTAFHATVANSFSIGIELEDGCGNTITNPDTGKPICEGGHRRIDGLDSEFNKKYVDWETEPLWQKAALLVRDIAARLRVPLTHPAGNEIGSDQPGVIEHGQVLGRSPGKTDPENWDPLLNTAIGPPAGPPEGTKWQDFMTRTRRGLGLQLHSPANLLVVDAQGRRSGVDPTTGLTLLEIPGTEFSGPGTEPETLFIPHATEGEYTIQVNGTGHGVYHLDVFGGDEQAGLSKTFLTGTTAPGQVTNYSLDYSASTAEQNEIDGVPHASISGVTARELDSGVTTFDFNVSLSSPPAQTVTLDYSTVDGTATTADNDYVAIEGRLTFAPGDSLTKTIRVTVNGDRREEAYETFLLNLTNVVNATVDESQGVGTIQNDDTTISIDEVAQREGDAGPSAFVFTASLSQASVLPVTIEYATANGTATLADNDYEAQTGSVTFAPGEIRKSISITVMGDLKTEADESLTVNLVNPVNAPLDFIRAQAKGAILDDDSGGASYYINDASTVGDVFTSAPGNNANDGRSPATPLASLPGLLSLYTFHPADTIYVDTGAYALVRNVTLGPQYNGVRIVGAGQRRPTQSFTADVILADNPVAYWRLGDTLGSTAVDATGRGFDGIYSNGTTRAVVGVSEDGAAEFHGDDQGVIVPDASELNPETFSVEAWINYRGSPNGTGTIVDKSSDGWTNGYRLALDGGNLTFFGITTNFGDYVSAPLSTHGQWVHVVGTFDGSVVSLYVNGKLVASKPVPAPVVSTAPLQIGNGPGSPGGGGPTKFPWNGFIDEVALYDQALTPEQVLTHFQHVTWTGVVLNRGNKSAGSYGIEFAGADDVTVSSLSITGAAAGIFAGADAGSQNITVLNTELYGNGQGMTVEVSNNQPRLVDSVVHGSSQSGIYVAAESPLIIGSVFFGNNGPGIETFGPDPTIRNNLVNDNGAEGISVIYGVRGLVTGNDVYRNNVGIFAHTWSVPASGPDRLIVSSNLVHENSTGIRTYAGDGGEVEVIGNEVFDNSGVGIQLEESTDAWQNVVHNNQIGINQSPKYRGGSWTATSDIISGNKVFDNRDIGIRAIGESVVYGNTVYSNRVGISGDRDISAAGRNCHTYANIAFEGVIANNVIYGNADQGILVSGATAPQITNNTVYQRTGDAVRIEMDPPAPADFCFSQPTQNAKLRNNIIAVESGYGISVDNDSQQGFTSDYNLLYATGAGRIGFWQGDFASFFDWKLEVNQDLHSITADPLFLNPLGADGILGYDSATGFDGGGDDDFHVRSDSPAIDRGDPAADLSAEPVPNGGRINIGSYGNTPEATPSAAAGLILQQTDGSTDVTEAGNMDGYSVVLTRPPIADVVVTVNSDSQLSVSPSSLAFTISNWNIAQNVSVRAVDDVVHQGSRIRTISHAIVSADAGYDGFVVPQLSVLIMDNDPTNTPWRNSLNQFDVSGDTHVASIDALIIINEINSPQYVDARGKLPDLRPQNADFIDVTGDGYATSIDALLVINELNGIGQAEAESNSAPTSTMHVDRTSSSDARKLAPAAIMLFAENRDVRSEPSQFANAGLASTWAAAYDQIDSFDAWPSLQACDVRNTKQAMPGRDSKRAHRSKGFADDTEFAEMIAGIAAYTVSQGCDLKESGNHATGEFQ